MAKLLNLIVACSENRVMGRGGRLPWRIPEDAQFLRDATAGNVCLMGRVSFATWPRATHDGRRAIVVTRDAGLARENVYVVPSLSAGLARAETLPGEIFVCGGQRIFAEALTLARPMRLFLTLVHAQVDGDTFFPEWRHLDWREVARRESADANYRYTFFTLER